MGQRRARRAAAIARPRSLGRGVTWAGRGRASQPWVTLYLRPGPRAQAAGIRGRFLTLSKGSASQSALAARSGTCRLPDDLDSTDAAATVIPKGYKLACILKAVMGPVKELWLQTLSPGVSDCGKLHPTPLTYEGWRTGDLILKFSVRFGSSFHLAQKLWSLPGKCIKRLRHLAYSHSSACERIKPDAGEGAELGTSQRSKAPTDS